MFEKLITDLKKSLPESLRKKLGGAEDLEEEVESAEEETESEDVEIDATSAEEEKKKKMKSMAIKVIVIIGLGYFALDEFVLKGMQQQSEADIFAQAPKRKKAKVVKPAEETAAAAATDPAATPATTEIPTEPVLGSNSVPDSDPTMSSDPTTEATAPIENINVLDKSAETTAPPVEPTVEEPVVTETRVPEASVDQRLDQLVENVEPAVTPTQTSTVSDSSTSTSAVEEIKVPSQGEVVEKVEKSTPSMSSMIVDSVVETPPPAYDQMGRGLVYNCKDKYWACLDKPAYVTCNKNMKWNKSKGNSNECVVSNIYGSDEDCAKVQKFNVSTNASTSFCAN